MDYVYPQVTQQHIDDAATWQGAQGLESQLTDIEAAEDLPRADLDRDQALNLLSSVFGPVIESPAGIFDDLQVLRFISDRAAVIPGGARPDTGGVVVGDESAEVHDGPVLLESTVPLRTESPTGEMEAVDLGLEHVAGDLEPSNPLIDVEIPRNLGDGIEIGNSGVQIELPDAPEGRSPSTLAESAVAFYPNIAADTDLVVAPTPEGIETFTQLRTPTSPRSQSFHLDLPAGVVLERTYGGGAEAVRDDGKIVLRVSPPSAIDASGAEVPVSTDIFGHSMILHVSPDDSTEYPVLVDPLFQTYQWYDLNTTQGMSDFVVESNEPKIKTGTMWSTALPNPGLYLNSPGLYVQAQPNTQLGAGSSVAWSYYVPRLKADEATYHTPPQSFVSGMFLQRLGFFTEKKVNGVSYTDGGQNPRLWVGIWDGKNSTWPSSFTHDGPQGQITNFNATFNFISTDENAKVAEPVGLSTTAWRDMTTNWRTAYIGYAGIEVADTDKPTWGPSIGPGWVNNTASAPLTISAADLGLGVKRLTFKPQGLPVAPGWWTTPTCAGTASSPCPREFTSAFTGYEPAKLSQGIDQFTVNAEDPLGNKAEEPIVVLVKVDHTKPGLALSGSLTEQAKVGTTRPEYSLSYSATDGDDTSPAALAPIGPAGTGETKPQRPQGVATDGKGNVWVVDRENSRILKFDEEGKYLSQFGSPGTGNGQFVDARGIAISAAGNIWISDTGNGRLQQFNSKGEFLQKFGTKGTGGGTKFVEPFGIATAPGGKLWVADNGAPQRVSLFRESVTNESERFILNIYGSASNPTGEREVGSPADMDTDAAGNVWLVDHALHRVQAYGPDGKFITQFGSQGTGNGQLKNPINIAIAPSGNIMVADRANNRLQEFKPDGTYLRQFGSSGAAANQFSEPKGIAFGANNVVFVADYANGRVARWSHADQDPQSGVVSTDVKVDGQLVEPKYAPGCASKNCSIAKSWTYKAPNYTSGQHTVEVTATDGVGLSSTRTLVVNSVKDMTAPVLKTSGTIFTAPEGWVEQKSYGYVVSATDPGGYGATSLVLKVDGATVSSKTQSCPNGGCEAVLMGTLNMANYDGGAHSAELIATDGAGLITKNTWTINVNPKGNVPTSEATTTLEALEETTDASPVAPTSELLDPEQMAQGDNPALAQTGEVIESTGIPNTTTMATDSVSGFTMDGPDGALTVAPVNPSETEASTEIAEDVAAVAANTATGVDTIIRPQYNGAMSFAEIRGATSPESFSWELQLDSEQSLKLVDDRHAEVRYDNGPRSFLITAEHAHDATGKAVDTSLGVNGNILTLIVKHNVAGTVYPVLAGQAYETSYHPAIVTGPLTMPEEEEFEDEGTPFRTPFPPSVGNELTVGEVKRLLLRPRGASPLVPAPSASASSSRLFEVNKSVCHPEDCAAWEVEQDTARYIRYENSVEWVNGTEIHCHGDIDLPFLLSTSIEIVNAGFRGPWKVERESGKKLFTWCHFILDVWAVPEDYSKIPGIPSPEKALSMVVRVFPNGFQQYLVRQWDYDQQYQES